LRLCPFGLLAKNPLAQESNDFNVHKRDFTQVHEYANAVIVHLSLYVADIGRLNSTNELRGSGVSVRLLFNPQHWQLLCATHPSVHDECHLQTIEGKRGILILDDAFSANDADSPNWLNRRMRGMRAEV
jgi:hypothetical protein